jgi:N-acetylneuraminic acid mutarotase
MLFCILNTVPVSNAGDNWVRKNDVRETIFSSAAATVGDEIYVVSCGVVPKITRVYDPVTDSWDKKANTNTIRIRLSASVVNGRIYLIGGTADNHGPGVMSTVEEYDPATDKWTEKADMPTPRHSLATCVVDDKIYAIGGTKGSVPDMATIFVNAVEVYDPAKDQWEEKAEMPELFRLHSSGVIDGKIYVIGTDLGQDSVLLQYDPVTDQWENKAAPAKSHYNGTAAVVNGRIYAIGGVFNWIYSASVEEYDPSTDTWQECADMPTARCDISSAAMNGKIYVFGGWNGGFANAVEEYTPPDRRSPGKPQQAVYPQSKLISTWSIIKACQ